MIRAMIFDFNGVIVDDETPHTTCFRQALSEAGLSLTVEDYYGRYLGMDERTCAAMLLAARDGTAHPTLLDRIADRKAALFQTYASQHQPALFPGVAEFVKAAGKEFRLAIASGGRRSQILQALAGTSIEAAFEAIVAAEDCPSGKPDPAIYRITLSRLNSGGAGLPHLEPPDCLVFEDSLAGIRAARDAGMPVAAVATTYPAEKLREAEAVLRTFIGLTPKAAIWKLAHRARAR